MIDWVGRSLTSTTAAPRAARAWRGLLAGVADQAGHGRQIARSRRPEDPRRRRRRVKRGQSGTLYFRSPGHAFEYTRIRPRPPRPARMATNPGDVGYLDADDYLFSPAEPPSASSRAGQIYPQEIDNELLKHPAVADACTIGVPTRSGARRSSPCSPSTPAMSAAMSSPRKSRLGRDISPASRCRARSSSSGNCPEARPARCCARSARAVLGGKRAVDLTAPRPPAVYRAAEVGIS